MHPHKYIIHASHISIHCYTADGRDRLKCIIELLQVMLRRAAFWFKTFEPFMVKIIVDLAFGCKESARFRSDGVTGGIDDDIFVKRAHRVEAACGRALFIDRADALFVIAAYAVDVGKKDQRPPFVEHMCKNDGKVAIHLFKILQDQRCEGKACTAAARVLTPLATGKIEPLYLGYTDISVFHLDIIPKKERYRMDIKAALLRDKIVLSDTFFDQVAQYKKHLFQWNKVHNLTGVKSNDEADEFIYDAVYPVGFLPEVKSAMDIGTGAGFPGLILAMALPQTHFTLVEPLKKRSSFLQFIVATLGLKNVKVQSCRVEELPPQHFDLVTSRAVTDTQMLLNLSEPYAPKGTLLLFYKGEKVYDEVDASAESALNFKIIQTDKRHYLLIEK